MAEEAIRTGQIGSIWESAREHDKRLRKIKGHFMARSLRHENYGLVNTERLHISKEDFWEKDLMLLFPSPNLFQMNETLVSTAAIM